MILIRVQFDWLVAVQLGLEPLYRVSLPRRGERLFKMAKKERRAPVWAKEELSKAAEENSAFCAGRDVSAKPMADEVLIPYDLIGSTAHALMLHEVGILEAREAKSILSALMELLESWESGELTLDPAREDVHMNVESMVIEKCGAETGGRLHTGRSRNDQAACDARLYLRDKVVAFHKNCCGLMQALLSVGREQARTIMPGFSHRQHGAVSTLGHWALCHAQAVSRDLERLESLFGRVNRNPLGAAAGYGTSWPINRSITTRLLGFESLLENSLDAVSSRGEMEAEFASVVAILMNHLSRIGGDLIFFVTDEAGFARLADSFVTGSSIMPQKRNPDFCEVLMAKAAFAQGCLTGLLSLTKGSLSGYNRELQWSKYIVMDLADECLAAPGLLSQVLESTQFDKARLRQAASKGFLQAVDLADWLARERKMPFRDAYRVAASSVRSSQEVGELTLEVVNASLPAECEPLSSADLARITDLEQCLRQREHCGSPSPSQVKTAERVMNGKLHSAFDWQGITRAKLEAVRPRLESKAFEIID